jgi:hypothetical protein
MNHKSRCYKIDISKPYQLSSMLKHGTNSIVIIIKIGQIGQIASMYQHGIVMIEESTKNGGKLDKNRYTLQLIGRYSNIFALFPLLNCME